ncbi:MAG: hypothetical protein ACKN9T_08590 [Candidatus Methylumidiphilus sp.]
MLVLEIDNPKIEHIFETQFHGNKAKFISFIQDSLVGCASRTLTNAED